MMTSAFGRMVSGFVLLAVLAGCGGGSSDGPKLYTVSGKITFDGQPLASGSVLFQDPTGNSQSYFANIKDGQYSTQAEAGKRVVQITAIRQSPDKMVPDAAGTGMEPASEQYIPAHYNEKSTLEVDIAPNNQNTFNYDLTSK